MKRIIFALFAIVSTIAFSATPYQSIRPSQSETNSNLPPTSVVSYGRGCSAESKPPGMSAHLLAYTSGVISATTIAETDGTGGTDFVGSVSGVTLTVTTITSPSTPDISAGYSLAGFGILPSTHVVALVGGSGGTGTYTVSPSQTTASINMSATPATTQSAHTWISSVYNSGAGAQSTTCPQLQ